MFQPQPIKYEAKSDAETIPIRMVRRGKVPLAFEVDKENSKFIVSVPLEVVALKQLYKMSKNINYAYIDLQAWYKLATKGKHINTSDISRMRHGQRIPLAVKL